MKYEKIFIGFFILTLLVSFLPISSHSIAAPEEKLDSVKKIDSDFYEKISLMIEKGETRDYDVIIYVSRPSPDADGRQVAKVNKDVIENNLKTKLHSKNVLKANVLSFVTATIPLKEIEKLAKDDRVFQICDGEAIVLLEMVASRGAVNASCAI
jgi:hypothetical protein